MCSGHGNNTGPESRSGKPVMLKFISKTLLSIVMEPDARDKLEKINQARRDSVENHQPTPDKAPYVEPDNEINVNPEPPAKRENPERRELIRNALEVQRSKSAILDGLSLENRMKLRLLAQEIFKNPSSIKKR